MRSQDKIGRKPENHETVNRLKVEHRTSNFERPIVMSLRFIYFKTSEPQNTELQPATSSAESNF